MSRTKHHRSQSSRGDLWGKRGNVGRYLSDNRYGRNIASRNVRREERSEVSKQLASSDAASNGAIVIDPGDYWTFMSELARSPSVDTPCIDIPAMPDCSARM